MRRSVKWRSPSPISTVKTNRRGYSLPRLLHESWTILSNISLPAMRRIKNGALPFLRQFLPLKLIAEDVQISLRILDHSFEYLSVGHATNQKWRSLIPSLISIVETNRRRYCLSRLLCKSWTILSNISFSLCRPCDESKASRFDPSTSKLALSHSFVNFYC